MQAVTRCLNLSSEVLVVAIVCIEKVLRKHPTYLRVYTLRPMLIAACLIALKFTDDYVDTRKCWKKLRAAFDDLDFDWLLVAEEQMVMAIDHHLPMGITYQNYADAMYRVANERSGEERTAPRMLDNEVWQ